MTASTAGPPFGGRRAVAAVGLVLVWGVGCADGESTHERYCDAGEALRESVGALIDLDVVSGGSDALGKAVDEVRDDLDDMSDAASAATEDDVDAFDETVDQLSESISSLGDDLSRDNASAVGDALGDVAGAAQDVFGTLGDC